MESNWKFQRGDIYFVKLEAGVGSEQNGARPAVILQNDVGNIYSPTLIVAVLTSKTDMEIYRTGMDKSGKAARMEEIRFPHLHGVQRQVPQGRAACEVLSRKAL